METEILALIQFAFTVAFHYIYPPLVLGYTLFVYKTFAGKVEIDENSY